MSEALVENWEFLPVRSKKMIRRMLALLGVDEPSVEMLAEEALQLRVRSGWFVWEHPSTARACRTKKMRLAVPAFEVPVFPTL